MGKTRGSCRDLWEGWRKSTSSFQDPTSVLSFSWQIQVFLSLLLLFFAGRSALCQDIMPSVSTYPHQGLSSGNRWGRRPFPCPSKLLKAAHWEPTSTPWPSRKPPTPGKAPTLYTHLTEGANLAWFTCSISHTRLNVFLSLSGLREDGWLSAMPSSTEGADLPYLILPLRVQEKKTVQEEWPQPMPYSQTYWLRDNSINKQINGSVYKAKWNSTVLNEDVFALRRC